MNFTLPAELNILPAAEQWAVARTGARWEKAVQRFFDEQHTPSFLPIVTARRVYGRKIRDSQLPLFGGYVFFDHTAIDKATLYHSPRIAQVLIPDNPLELRADLENLSLALRDDHRLKSASALQPGRNVIVKHGPMSGLCGTLVRNGMNNKLFITVRFLGAIAELEIDEALVEPA